MALASPGVYRGETRSKGKRRDAHQPTRAQSVALVSGIGWKVILGAIQPRYSGYSDCPALLHDASETRRYISPRKQCQLNADSASRVIAMRLQKPPITWSEMGSWPNSWDSNCQLIKSRAYSWPYFPCW